MLTYISNFFLIEDIEKLKGNKYLINLLLNGEATHNVGFTEIPAVERGETFFLMKKCAYLCADILM